MHIDSNQPSSGTCRPSVGRVSRDHGATAIVAGSSQDKLGGDCCKLIFLLKGVNQFRCFPPIIYLALHCCLLI